MFLRAFSESLLWFLTVYIFTATYPWFKKLYSRYVENWICKSKSQNSHEFNYVHSHLHWLWSAKSFYAKSVYEFGKTLNDFPQESHLEALWPSWSTPMSVITFHAKNSWEPSTLQKVSIRQIFLSGVFTAGIFLPGLIILANLLFGVFTATGITEPPIMGH